MNSVQNKQYVSFCGKAGLQGPFILQEETPLMLLDTPKPLPRISHQPCSKLVNAYDKMPLS